MWRFKATEKHHKKEKPSPCWDWLADHSQPNIHTKIWEQRIQTVSTLWPSFL
jgi:hypothetical protein